MIDTSKVSKKDAELVSRWVRDYRSNCRAAKGDISQDVFEYLCDDCDRLIKLMRPKGVMITHTIK